MAKVFLKQEVKDLINTKLREVLIIRQDGMCEYPPGWSDVAIVQALGGGVITEIGVTRLRQANFGRLHKPPKAKPAPRPLPVSGVSKAAFDELVLRVTEIEEHLTRTSTTWKGDLLAREIRQVIEG